MSTEVYSCKEGQPLKQGKLDYCDIDTKDEAESDAKRRCQRDPTLKKIAYYKVSPDGEFRIFYSYTNPNCKAVPARGAGGVPPGAAKRKRKPPPKLGFFARLKKAIGFG